jgi:trehalose 6-phosphate phosphatase
LKGKEGRFFVNDGKDCRKHATRERRKGRRSFARVGGHVGARYLFDGWPQVVRSLRSATRLVLFIDFDGTLAPLRRRPTHVKPLDLVLRRILRRLAGHKRLTLYVISGRRLSELRKLASVPGVRLLGLYGWEGRSVPPLDAERRLLRKARQLLDQRLPDTSQIWLEDKGLALTVHYRGAPQRAVRLARPIVLEVLRVLGPRLHMIHGHKVWELLPHQIDGKGSAVCALLAKLPPHTLPMFVGDDATDESAFGVLPHGLTIRVGRSPRTKARFRLRNPDEVRIFLRKLQAEIA